MTRAVDDGTGTPTGRPSAAFEEPGTCGLVCTIHSGQEGEVVVPAGPPAS